LKRFFILGLFLALILLLSSCSKEPYAEPSCRVSEQAINSPLLVAGQVQSACVLKIDNRLLVIERASGLYDIAFSQSLSYNPVSNLVEPAFFDEYILMNENGPITVDYKAATSLTVSSACAAHTAAWDQGGFNVNVGEALLSRPVVSTGDQIVLYACKLQAGFDGSEPLIQAPPWQTKHVTRMLFIDPFELEQDQWENPDHFVAVRDAFISAPNSSQ